LGFQGGGIAIENLLTELRDRLENYFGALNEIREGLNTKLPPKPEELQLHELLQMTGLPLLAGGYMDQPHIWLKQQQMVIAIKEMFDALRRQKEKAEES
jgi:hypothetical protein